MIVEEKEEPSSWVVFAVGLVLIVLSIVMAVKCSGNELATKHNTSQEGFTK
ncbi:MAG TPA: hypothetical protein VFE57_05580 [Cyclobacteriaceae bacterium]|jgi:uncharacterized integral membrane protein|nr:hypothetical protein [Cyclobacteriaceae bacterium]